MSHAVGVIGAGFHSSANILPASVLAGLSIDSLATRDLERSRAALVRFGSSGAAYDSAESLLERDGLSAVVIVAQASDQARLTRRAIRARKHVFTDKPLGWNASEAAEIAREADEAGVIVMVGFMKRYAPLYQRVFKMLASQVLGPTRAFHFTLECDATHFCDGEERFLKLASIHMTDLVRFLFGEVADVHVFSNTIERHIALAISFRMESGVVGTMDFTGVPAYSSENEVLRITGDTGYAVAENLSRLTIHTDGHAPRDFRALAERTEVWTPTNVSTSGIEQQLTLRGFVGELRAFDDALSGGTMVTSTARDNVKTMELVDRILAAALAARPSSPEAPEDRNAHRA